MSHQSELIATDIEAYLAEHEQKDMLRFLTCGSVDDGKSTLIGRLLHDSHLLYEDQLAAVEAESTTIGSAGGELDLALLMDGLKAEREQGITIDVAYRYFSTSRRKFIIADTPGHEQYTRNMVTGASTCDLAIILVDARHGVQPQTKRHSYLTSLLGIENTVVAINKMDLVDHSKERYEEIRDHYLDFAERLDLKKAPWFIPISALKGDWVVDPGTNMTWFEGPTLMEHLETVAGDRPRGRRPALPGPARAAPGPDLPGLRGDRGLGLGAARGRDHGPALRRGHRGGPAGHLQRRPRPSRPRHGGHRDPGRRGRRVPGRRAGPPRAATPAQPRGRGHGGVDERDRDGPGQGVPRPAGQPDRPRPRHLGRPPGRHQHPRARARHRPRGERDRPLHGHLRPAAPLRRLRPQPDHRGVHPGRPRDQRHGGRRR